nr:MAG TPA: hypothetical protein [Caudoviricetes sp.]
MAIWRPLFVKRSQGLSGLRPLMLPRRICLFPWQASMIAWKRILRMGVLPGLSR